MMAFSLTVVLGINACAGSPVSPDAPARTAIGDPQTVLDGDRTVGYYTSGKGSTVVLSASAGREVSDFNELVVSLNDAGYRTLAVEAPGIGNTDPLPRDSDLYSYAQDLMSAVNADASDNTASRLVLVGHAFGNRVVRAFAQKYPERSRGVILLAAGGQVAIEPTAFKALEDSFDSSLSKAEREEQIRYAFFAGDNQIPDYWLRGWHGETALIQGIASSNTTEGWQMAGSVPMLIVQPSDDRIAPTADAGQQLLRQRPDAEMLTIEDAGHALLPEQPEAVAEAVVDQIGQWISGTGPQQ